MLETKRERAIVFGGVPVAALLLYILLAGPGEEEAEPAPVPPAVAAVPARAPIPPPVVPAAPPPVVAPVTAAPAATPAATSVTLAGVSGGGGRGGSAILAYGGGAQRIVAVGREVMPGVTLREVRGDRIVLAGPGGLSELRVGGTTTGIGGGTASASPAAGNPRLAADAAARSYVRAAEPQRVGGRVVGYRVRSAGDIPVLARAGLQAGDILVSVNGNAIDGVERLTGIPAEVAGAASVDVEFVRAGRRMRARVANQ